MNVEGEAPTSADWLRGKKVPAAAAGQSPCCLESLFSQAQCQPPPSELLSPGEGAEPKKSLPSQLLASAPGFPASPVLSGPLAMTRKESREQVIEKGCPKASPRPQAIHQAGLGASAGILPRTVQWTSMRRTCFHPHCDVWQRAGKTEGALLSAKGQG